MAASELADVRLTAWASDAHIVPTCLDDITTIKTLGTGAYGTVSLVRLVADTSYEYAVKSMSKDHIDTRRMRTNVLREITLHSQLDHPNIVHLVTVFETPTDIHVALEYVPGWNLQEYRTQHNSHRRMGCPNTPALSRVPVATAKSVATDIGHALKYVHSRHILHRDVKPENILITSTGRAKLADFGLATYMRPHLREVCGTVDFCAPEVLSGQDYDYAADWWSLGVVIYEMLTGHLPYEDSDSSWDLDDLVAYMEETPLDIPEYVDAVSKDLLVKLLQLDPHERVRAFGDVHGHGQNIADAILSHPWFKG